MSYAHKSLALLCLVIFGLFVLTGSGPVQWLVLSVAVTGLALLLRRFAGRTI